MKKTIHITIGVLFIVFAALQYNDPDPLLWMLIYGAVALVAFLKVYFTQINFGMLIVTFMTLYILYALTYIPSFLEYLKQSDKMELISQMQATKPWIEETRELGGLILAVLALLYMRLKR